MTRKFGKENVVLLNHDINPSVESQDIKSMLKAMINLVNVYSD